MKNKIYYFFIGLIILSGIFLRILVYSHIRPLWFDEEALAGSIIEAFSIKYFFLPLKFFQKAPPIFMCSTFILSNLLGIKELVLRIIPFMCSILSIPLFFMVSKSFLQSKKAIVFANILFAVNYRLIYYSQEFKPYATDMFIVLLLIYLSTYIDFNKFSKFKIFLYSLSNIVILLCSFPSAFAIGAIYLTNIKKTKEIIKHIIYLLPIAVFGVFYYIKLLLPLRNRELKYFISYWDDGFISFNIQSLWHILQSNIQYIFYPGKSILIILLFVAGIFLFIRNKNQRTQTFLIMLILAIVASLLHLYPIKQRMILYLIPFILLSVSKPLDLINTKRSLISLIICTIYLLPFSIYGKLGYYKHFFLKEDFMWQDSRTGLQIIINNIKNGEIIAYNRASRPSLYYYSTYFNMENKNEIIEIKGSENEKDYLRELDKLEKNKSYWFYYPYYINNKAESPFVKKWVEKNNLKAEYFTFKKSFVAHIRPK